MLYNMVGGERREENVKGKKTFRNIQYKCVYEVFTKSTDLLQKNVTKVKNCKNRYMLTQG